LIELPADPTPYWRDFVVPFSDKFFFSFRVEDDTKVHPTILGFKFIVCNADDGLHVLYMDVEEYMP